MDIEPEAVFMPPPGWPPIPSGWLPESDWSPAPDWPAAPAGWQFYKGSYGEPVDPPPGRWGPTSSDIPDGEKPEMAPREPTEVPIRPQGERRLNRRALWIAAVTLGAVALVGAAIAITRGATPLVGPASNTASGSIPKWTLPSNCPTASSVRELPGWSSIDLEVISDRASADGTLACQLYAAWTEGGVRQQAGISVTSSVNAGQAETLSRGFNPQPREATELGEGATEIRYTSHNISGQGFPGCYLEVPLTSPTGTWLIVGASGSSFTQQQGCDTALRLLQSAAG